MQSRDKRPPDSQSGSGVFETCSAESHVAHFQAHLDFGAMPIRQATLLDIYPAVLFSFPFASGVSQRAGLHCLNGP